MCISIPTKENRLFPFPEVIKIETDAEGVVVERPNRFLCIVDIAKPESLKAEMVHVHDPGRLEDILYPGNRVLLKRADGKKRKTRWDLIAGNVRDEWILVNSAWHRKISEWVIENKVIPFLNDVDLILPEQKYGDSRLDFLLMKREQSIWMEVKGCTFAQDGIALFPDAPTTRGKRHLEELIKARNEGHEAVVMILVLRRDAECFAPNDKIDPDFAITFKKAIDTGVKVFPLQLFFENNTVYFHSILPIFKKG
ncbi:DNA/RNA nuclease SfsA [Methanolobus sp. ZRKC2]|uniref:DNA/RNA nuclease SfsA n=1 Tax=Methanolobus sp. ZRKC2 TaxID=3125783 RepID=UPI003252C936